MLNESVGNVWSYVGTHVIIIPTNQIGVMGAGLALQAKKNYPNIQVSYQAAFKAGHNPRLPWRSDAFPDLILAPTKRHWKDSSRLDDLSFVLKELAKEKGGPFVLPEMGCGLGGLKWEQTQLLYMVFCAVDTDWTVVHPK